MKQIKTVAIIGLGALGTMYADFFSRRLPHGAVRVVANAERIARYQREGVICNGKKCELYYMDCDSPCEPADLVIFCVKQYQLRQAMLDAKHQIGADTVIMSVLNGVISEEVIGEMYGMDKMIFTVAQQMDALKRGNELIYRSIGVLAIGDKKGAPDSDKVARVAEFFAAVDFPYEIPDDIEHRMWGKLMLNVGVNQTAAVYHATFAEMQKPGPIRETVLGAMREVLQVAQRRGVALTEADYRYWIDIFDDLNPAGKPSMLQDVEAGRPTEVELFAGTISRLGREYGVPTPVNDFLLEKLS